MNLLGRKDLFDSVFSQQNWEDDIAQVLIESCDRSEDPLGYRAVYYVNGPLHKPAFSVGASYLKQRKDNIVKTGFCAPMTDKAISLVEHKIGRILAETVC